MIKAFIFLQFSFFLYSLKLKTCVVIHSKTNHKVTRHLFCELTDRNSEQTNYATTRLACLLVKNNEILWDTLTLSNAMAFVSKIRTFRFDNKL